MFLSLSHICFTDCLYQGPNKIRSIISDKGFLIFYFLRILISCFNLFYFQLIFKRTWVFSFYSFYYSPDFTDCNAVVSFLMFLCPLSSFNFMTGSNNLIRSSVFSQAYFRVGFLSLSKETINDWSSPLFISNQPLMTTD